MQEFPSSEGYLRKSTSLKLILNAQSMDKSTHRQNVVGYFQKWNGVHINFVQRNPHDHFTHYHGYHDPEWTSSIYQHSRRERMTLSSGNNNQNYSLGQNN